MVSTIAVQLKHNQTLIVDAIDSDLLQAYPWYSAKNGRNWYAIYTLASSTTLRLHRFILARILGRDLTTKDCVDHINGNGMDNRRKNIRLATRQQNRMNSRKVSTKTSKYKGAYWNKNSNKWQASIRVNGRNKSLGYFVDEKDAHIAYCNAAKDIFGEFASPNGIEKEV